MDLVAVLLTRRDHIGHTFPLVPPLDPSAFRTALGSLPTTQVELIEGAGRRPHLEATGRLLELLLPIGT